MAIALPTTILYLGEVNFTISPTPQKRHKGIQIYDFQTLKNKTQMSTLEDQVEAIAGKFLFKGLEIMKENIRLGRQT